MIPIKHRTRTAIDISETHLANILLLIITRITNNHMLFSTFSCPKLGGNSVNVKCTIIVDNTQSTLYYYDTGPPTVKMVSHNYHVCHKLDFNLIFG